MALFFSQPPRSLSLSYYYGKSFCFVIWHFSVTAAAFLFGKLSRKIQYFLGDRINGLLLCVSVFIMKNQNTPECGKMETKVFGVVSKKNMSVYHKNVCFFLGEREQVVPLAALCAGCRCRKNGKSRHPVKERKCIMTMDRELTRVPSRNSLSLEWMLFHPGPHTHTHFPLLILSARTFPSALMVAIWKTTSHFFY